MTPFTRGAGAVAAAAIAIMAASDVSQARWLKNDPSLPVRPAVEATLTTEEAEEPATTTTATAEEGGLTALIAHHATEAGVPVALAHAVVRIESNYNPKARGVAGAVGLMQIKPRTAQGIGYTGSVAGLYDPDTNLRWGMKYLAGAYELAGGDLCGTVMRYQGGHYARSMTRANEIYCGKARKFMAEAGTQTASR